MAWRGDAVAQTVRKSAIHIWWPSHILHRGLGIARVYCDEQDGIVLKIFSPAAQTALPFESRHRKWAASRPGAGEFRDSATAAPVETNQ